MKLIKFTAEHVETNIFIGIGGEVVHLHIDLHGKWITAPRRSRPLHLDVEDSKGEDIEL
jgi:hypothetical protein